MLSKKPSFYLKSKTVETIILPVKQNAAYAGKSTVFAVKKSEAQQLCASEILPTNVI